MSQFLLKWIFLVSIELIHNLEHIQKKFNMLWIMYEFNKNKKNPFEQTLAHFKVFWIQKLT